MAIICDNPWPDVEFRMDLEAAIATLTDKQREALLLYLEGYTQEEIGEMLGISHQAVSRRLDRACEQMRYFLG